MSITFGEIACMHWDSDARPLPRVKVPADDDEPLIPVAEERKSRCASLILEALPTTEWVLTSQIEKVIGRSESATRIALKELEAAGLVERGGWEGAGYRKGRTPAKWRSVVR